MEEMEPYDQKQLKSGFTLENVLVILRLLAAGLGVAAVAIGLFFAVKVFCAVFATLQEPEHFRPLLEEWTTVLGKEDLDLVIGEDTLPLARILATLVLGGGTVALTWIALGLVGAGAKVVSWTTSDREAIKRILRETFGSQGKRR